MAARIGREAAVKLGTNTIVGIGNWSFDGITIDLVEKTAFGDRFKKYELGLGDYGTVSFNGFWDMADTTGQAILWSHYINFSALNSLRFYVDATSYYTPNTNVTSSGGQADAGILLTTVKITQDKGDIARIDFTARMTGQMILM